MGSDLYEFFADTTDFTLLEAAAVLAGVPNWNSETEAACRVKFNALVNAAKSGELRVKEAPCYIYRSERDLDLVTRTWKNQSGTDWHNSTVSRIDLIAWCESRNRQPEALFRQEREHLPEKPLHESERRTLLNIIRALAELHGVTPIKTRATGDGWRKAAESLLADLASKGIDAPCNEKTLAGHLRNSFQELR